MKKMLKRLEEMEIAGYVPPIPPQGPDWPALFVIVLLLSAVIGTLFGPVITSGYPYGIG